MSSLEANTLDTPMIRQFKAIKEHHQDSILFFRMGDFYEMFLNDATVAAKALDLTLTGRGKDENRIPMCGIPHHASENYIQKLVKQGFKVAICEQVEDPAEAKGLTKREVIKTITPGTILNDQSLDQTSNNYLAAVYHHSKSNTFGLSYTDISTGEFKCCVFESEKTLQNFLLQLQVKECLITAESEIELDSSILKSSTIMLDSPRASTLLAEHFNIQSVSTFGIDHLTHAFPAAWGIIDYLKTTQKHSLTQIRKLTELKLDQTLQLDAVTIQNLELFETLYQKSKRGSLFWVLNDTKTAMGARKLKHWIHHPLIQIEDINARLDAVDALKQDFLSREEIRELLNQVYDLERLLSRIVSHNHNPRDVIALKQSLKALLELPSILNHLDAALFKKISKALMQASSPEHPITQTIQLIESAILDDPPALIRDGNIIKAGYSQELDTLKDSFLGIKQWIKGLEENERETSGIKALKVGFNKVFGYYFNIPNSYKGDVPEHYIRKQTLTNAERYITPELKEKELILLNGEEKQSALEQDLYKSLIHAIAQNIDGLQDIASIVATLDALQSFAHVAQKNNYVRPIFSPNEALSLSLTNSRHPVLEKTSDQPVISNSLDMSKDSQNFFLITGPNMAGKSTLMKQVALCTIMAQCGSFVSADAMSLSIVDKLFTRIGASDNLYTGQSTFMVEMVETAAILHNATQQSLIILDEIGRGTSTFDGMSIAGAVTKHIHNTLKSRTFFATHYHELTSLSSKLSCVQNYSMSIKESNQKLIFTYKLQEGPADKSYGIHVAQIAGLPSSVITEAEALLETFESNTQNSPKVAQLSLF